MIVNRISRGSIGKKFRPWRRFVSRSPSVTRNREMYPVKQLRDVGDGRNHGRDRRQRTPRFDLALRFVSAGSSLLSAPRAAVGEGSGGRGVSARRLCLRSYAIADPPTSPTSRASFAQLSDPATRDARGGRRRASSPATTRKPTRPAASALKRPRASLADSGAREPDRRPAID